MKTFKQMQDNVLAWMADSNDTTMRALVKQALNQAQTQVLTAEQFDFLLASGSLSVVSGQQAYVLPDNWQQGLWIRNQTTREYLEEIPAKTIIEAEDGWPSTDDGNVDRFSLMSVATVKAQPSSASVITVTPSGGSEAAANGIVVQGLDASGNWIEEVLSSGSPWASLSTTTAFKRVDNIIKTGSTWTRTITATAGSTTLLALLAAEFAKQYQVLELVKIPTTSATLEYQYYVKPIGLVYDNQASQIPSPFEDILEYDALIKMQGYTRATDIEVQQWMAASGQLKQQMAQTYQQARTLNARLRRVTFNVRY